MVSFIANISYLATCMISFIPNISLYATLQIIMQTNADLELHGIAWVNGSIVIANHFIRPCTKQS